MWYVGGVVVVNKRSGFGMQEKSVWFVGGVGVV